MGTTLHAFRKYAVIGGRVKYIDDCEFIYTSDSWMKIYHMLNYCGKLTGIEAQIPIVGYTDKGLIEPNVFVTNLKAGLADFESCTCSLITTPDLLFDFAEYAKSLLKKAEDGRYFVWDKD